MHSETRRIATAAAVIGGLSLLAWVARHALGLEWNAESIRQAVGRLGVWGPVFFVPLVALRSFLLIPSQILLIAAGLCFGTAAGAVYGALGILGSGGLAFGVSRWAGRDAVLRMMTPRLHRALDLAGSRAGAILIFLGTAYPIGPITAYHAGAGVTLMRVPVFFLALAPGAAIRAATYTWFGSSLAEGGMWEITAAGALVALLTALPLAHPRGRDWLRERLADARGEPAEGGSRPPTAGR